MRRRAWTRAAGGAATAIAALALALALTVALPAGARTRKVVSVELVGSLVISWQGDPARGCAAEGLCGVSGSLQMLPSGESSASPGPPPLELTDSNAVARVTDLSPTGATETMCAGLVPVDLSFMIRRSSARIDAPSSSLLPSSGDCAGPTAADLLSLALPARKLVGHGYDLSGQATLGAGPFTVTITSTVRALFNPPPISPLTGAGTSFATSTSSGSSLPRLPHPHHALEENANIVYRVEGFSGTLTTSFAGLAPPLCDPLGACGATGELSETLSTDGTLSFSGSRIVKHRVGSSTALDDLRAGRLGVYDNFGEAPIPEVVSETLRGPGGAVCTDTADASVSGQSVPPRGGELKFVLAGPNLGLALGADPLRTRCPGPSGSDVFGTAPIASGRVSSSALGDPSLTLTFDSSGSFTGGAYGGQHGGSVGLSLVLLHASGGTSRVTLGKPLPLP